MRNNSNFSFSASVTCIHFLISMLAVVEKIAGTVFWLQEFAELEPCHMQLKIRSLLVIQSVVCCFQL